MSDLKQVLEELEKSKQNGQQLQPAADASQEQKEVFSSKSYWCRYFDYFVKRKYILTVALPAAAPPRRTRR